MKKLLLLSFLLLLAVAIGGYWFFNNSRAVTSKEEFSFIVIEKGSSATQIGNKLQSEGLIRNALVFKLYLRVTGQTNKLQAGEFRLSPSFTLFETIDTLFKGPVELWVTIPEGLRREEIAQKFKSALGKDEAFVAEFLTASKGQEGRLFPETYLFPRDASAVSIVKRMTDTFTSKTGSLKNNSGLSLDQVVVLASIVERETKTDAERPMVAGILMNRLNADWPLQVDAAVQYAVGTSKNWWPILTLDDLSIKSAYNTYKNSGLPPAPIANPGLSSIKGVMNPTENDYWYYIHDTKGTIHYAKTLSEHNANISKYLGK